MISSRAHLAAKLQSRSQSAQKWATERPAEGKQVEIKGEVKNRLVSAILFSSSLPWDQPGLEGLFHQRRPPTSSAFRVLYAVHCSLFVSAIQVPTTWSRWSVQCQARIALIQDTSKIRLLSNSGHCGNELVYHSRLWLTVDNGFCWIWANYWVLNIIDHSSAYKTKGMGGILKNEYT